MSIDALVNNAPALQILSAGRSVPTTIRNYGATPPNGSDELYEGVDLSVIYIGSKSFNAFEHADMVLAVGESVTLDPNQDWWFIGWQPPLPTGEGAPVTGSIYYGRIDSEYGGVFGVDNIAIQMMNQTLEYIIQALTSAALPGNNRTVSFTATNGQTSIPNSTYTNVVFVGTYDGSQGALSLRPSGKGIFLPAGKYKITGGCGLNTVSTTGERIALIGWVAGNADPSVAASPPPYLQAKFMSLTNVNGPEQSTVFDEQEITVWGNGITIGVIAFQNSGAAVSTTLDTYLSVKEI